MPARKNNTRVIEKRFREVEASVKAIASFVKTQSEKNRAIIAETKETLKPPKIDMTRYDSKIESLEREIKSIADAAKRAPVDTSKFQNNIDVLNQKISEIDSKFSEIERRKEIRGADVHEIGEDINEKLQEQGRLVLSDFERRIRGLKAEFERDIESRVEKSLGDEAKMLKNYVDGKLNELKLGSGSREYEHFYDDMRKTNAKLYDIESRIKSIPTSKELEAKVGLIERKIKDAGIEELRQMDNRLDRMKGELDTFATKKDMDALKAAIIEENKNQKIFEELEDLRIGDSEQATVHKSIDKRIQDIERELQVLRLAESAEEKADLKDVEDRIASLRNLIKDSEERSAFALRDAKELQLKLQEKFNNFATRKDIDNMKKLRDELEISIRNEMRQFVPKDDLNALRNKNDITLRELNAIKTVNEEQDTVHKTIEKRLHDIEMDIQKTYAAESAEEKADVRGIGERMKQLSSLVDDERRKRLSLTKNTQELETEINALRKEKTKALVSKEVEEKLNRSISKHIGEFAKIMDKRLPNVITREEHLGFMRDIEKRLQNIETPDFRNLVRRIEMLENQISEISTLARDVYNRIPVVVE